MTGAALSPNLTQADLGRYLNEIGSYPRMEQAQEADLARRIRSGEEEALTELVRSNLRFVVPVARMHRIQGVSLAYLINAGNEGLVQAARQFDATDGCQFVSYAMGWIRAAILHALRIASAAEPAPVDNWAMSSAVSFPDAAGEVGGGFDERGMAMPQREGTGGRPTFHVDTALALRDAAQANDTLLMEGIRDGDEHSFTSLLQRYWAPLVDYASRFTRGAEDEAQDLVQETFVRVWRQRAAWNSRGSVGAYLHRITRNLALNASRHRLALTSRERVGGDEIRVYAAGSGPAEDVEDRIIAEDIQLALAALPERRREVFTLSRFHGLTYQEIAETLGITRQTVANQMSAALAELRTSLARHLSD